MTQPSPAPSPTPQPKGRLQSLLSEYGPAALWVYLGIFILTLVGFAFAIRAGFEVESAAGTAGTWGAAYVATKVTQPIRIGATLAFTPFAARLFRRAKRETATDQR